MKTFLFFLGIQLLFISCSSPQKKETLSYAEKVKDYRRIVDGIKNEYVLHYRMLTSMGTNRKMFGLPISDTVFINDSSVYHQSYLEFFEQDYSLVEWLLTFENDTLMGGLWYNYQNPISSHIEDCTLHMCNSIAAIVLLENYLNGKGFFCYSCDQQDRHQCNKNKYLQVKNWLAQNKGLSILELRQKWKDQNAF